MIKRFRPILTGLVALLVLGAPRLPARAQTSATRQLFSEGFAQQSKGNYARALQIWNQIIQQDSGEPAAYLNRGITRFYMRDLRGAVEDMNAAITRKDDYATAYLNRGIILREMKDYAGAVADLERYLALAPNAADNAQARAVLTELRRRVATAPPATLAAARTTSSTAAASPAPELPTPLKAVTPARTDEADDRPSAPSLRSVPMTAAASSADVGAPMTASTPTPLRAPSTPAAVASTPLRVPSTPAAAASAPMPSAAATNTPTTTPLPPAAVASAATAVRSSATAVPLGKISGYDATTDDLLLGLKRSLQRELVPTNTPLNRQVPNFIALVRRGATIDQALKRSGLGRQSLIRLTWRGAAYRTYGIDIR